MLRSAIIKASVDKINEYDRNASDPVITDGDKEYQELCILRDIQALIQERVNQAWRAGLYNV